MNRKLMGITALILVVFILAACTPAVATGSVQNTPTPADVPDQNTDSEDPADDTAAETEVPEDTEDEMAAEFDGQALYDAMGCADCHGADRSGDFAPSILPDALTSNAQSYINTITNGRGRMPAWADDMTPEEIEALVNWLMTTAN